MDKVSRVQESNSTLLFPPRSKMGRNLVYPKVDKNTVHRKSDRGKPFQAMVYILK